MKRSGFGPRTTGLARNTELASRSELTRSPTPRTGPPTPQQQRRKAQLATWAEVKEQAHERDGWRCVGCGTPDGLDGHHRDLKQMGSSKLLDHIANAITLCRWRCHPWAHSYRNTDAIVRGWCVPRGDNPAEWAVTAWDGRWYYTDAGGRVAA